MPPVSSEILIRGYACPWNLTRVKGNDRAQLAPGSIVDDAIGADLVFGSHNPAAPFLASATDDTLQFWSNDYGLAFEARIHPSTLHLDRMVRQIRSGMGCSISYKPVSSKGTIEDGWAVRRIQIGELHHIAIVRDPSYAGTACWMADTPLASASSELQGLMRSWQVSNSERLATKVSPPVSDSVREAIRVLGAQPSLPDGKRKVRAIDVTSWPPGFAQ